MKFPTALGAMIALKLGVTTAPIGAESQRPQVPLVISSLSGSDLFQFYCATFHGPGGRGDGPVASSLKTPPADLTRIAARHGGHFPSEEIQRFVAGDDIPAAAHGTREMPVWGPIFYSLEPHDRLTRIRLENVVRYIETLQKP